MRIVTDRRQEELIAVLCGSCEVVTSERDKKRDYWNIESRRINFTGPNTNLKNKGGTDTRNLTRTALVDEREKITEEKLSKEVQFWINFEKTDP